MKTINKSDVDSRFEKSSTIALFSLIASLILGAISLYETDLRYFGVGIIIFSVGYMGHFAYWSWCMYKRDDKGKVVSHDVFSFILALVLSMSSVGLFFYGIAVFLHHYDIDALINLYIESINHFKN